jgi:hypothetical protein
MLSFVMQHRVRFVTILVLAVYSSCEDSDLQDNSKPDGCIIISGVARMHEFGSEIPSVLVSMAECEPLIESMGGEAILVIELDGEEYLRIPWMRETTRIATPANISAGAHDLTFLLQQATDAGAEIDSTSFQFFRSRIHARSQ